ncbi:MAG: PilZ domain-containing protein, partial [Planctomycetes bacterium]|nr:PilZ domain-containing protein [Planctomycetota bacterium]
MAAGRARRKVTQQDLARALGMHQGTVSRILAEVDGSTYPEDTRRRVRAAAIRLGYLHPTTVEHDQRQALRRALPAAAQVRVVLANGRLFARCRAPVLDVSGNGVLLGEFSGRRRHLPTRAFSLELEFSGALAGLSCTARPVRIESNARGFGLGVTFVALAAEDRARIEELVGRMGRTG